MNPFSALRGIAIAALLLAANPAAAAGDRAAVAMPSELVTVAVAGSGVDHLDTALLHSEEPTPVGMIRRSTETVELHGDLEGRVLYHVTSTFDLVAGTLVNSGDQVFSGTIAGSAPVLVHDDQFRFEVDLATGEESGKVYLLGHLAGPKVRCTLDVVGTGMNASGNPTFDYSGECTFRGR